MAAVLVPGTPVCRGIIAPLRLKLLVDIYAVLHYGLAVSHHDVVRCHSVGTVHTNLRELGVSS